MTLATFLVARIAEDEAMVRSFDADPYRIFENHRGLPFRKDRSELRLRWFGLMQGRPYSEARDRVFAECAAKRRIVAEHDGSPETGCTVCYDMGVAGMGPMAWPCLTLRILTLPYVDHPDYREEWRP